MGKSLRGKRLKRLGLFWMGVFLSFSLWAQTGVICGTVTDAKMKEPLIGASVVIEGTTVGAITDIDGNFRIENVRPGTYTVAASYVSYQTQTVKDVPVVARQEAVLNIELSDAITECGRSGPTEIGNRDGRIKYRTQEPSGRERHFRPTNQ